MAWLCSGGDDGFIASAFVTSVLTIGEEAFAKEPDRSALGLSAPEDWISILVEDPLSFVFFEFIVDFADLRA